jgi:transmembrane protein 216
MPPRDDSYGKQILSSLPLAILLYFNQWFSLAYFSLNACLFLNKTYHYHYPYSAFEWEIINLVILAFIENSRLFLAMRGNKTEQIPPLVWSMGLSIPMIVGFSYFLTIQTYVLRLDVILNVIALVFVCSEFILGLLTVATFSRGFTG